MCANCAWPRASTAVADGSRYSSNDDAHDINADVAEAKHVALTMASSH